MNKLVTRVKPVLFSKIVSFFLLSTVLQFANCQSLNVIPEPNLSQYTVKSPSVCLKWNWHPFCLDTKPNSLNVRGILNNNSGDKKFLLDYYLDSFDSDIPIGVSLKIDGIYYNLKKMQTDYADTLRLTSELNEEVLAKIATSKKPILLSYSNRKHTLNFEMSGGETDSLKENVKDVTEKVAALQKMKIVK